jgi:hypothetical protein
MALKEWSFHIHDESVGGVKYPGDGSGWMYVCTAGAVLPPTIYSNEYGSMALTSSATAHGALVNKLGLVNIANGYCRFWTEQSVNTLDVSYLMASGEAGFLKGVTNSRHHLSIRTDGGTRYQLWVPWAYLAGTTVVNTQLQLPAGLMITDANVKVVTTESADTVDVGFLSAGESGDEDGLLDGMLTTNAGLGVPWGVITSGTNIDYVSHAAGRYGDYLANWIVGADAVATVGGMTRKHYLTDGTIKTLTYTTSDSAAALGFFFLDYYKTMG